MTRRALLAALALTLVAAGASAQRSYLAFGDSITNGFGDSVSGVDAGYPSRLISLLADGSTIRKEGVDGEATVEGLTRLDGLLAEGGDVLLLMEGTNDVSRSIRDGISIETTFFNLREMANRAEAAGFEVVHATTIPRLPNARFDENNLLNQELNQEIRHLAGTTSRGLVDNFEIFSEQTNLFSRLYYDGPITDRVGHPNAAGYDVMAQTFFEVLDGVDAVPPVPGRIFPENGEDEVDPFSTIDVDVWDFGSGVDVSDAQLLVNGVVTGITPSGQGNRVNFTSPPPQTGLSGIVTVALRVSDLSVPAHTFDRQIARFTVSGTQALQGDIDGDGRVDGQDLIQLALSFGARSSSNRYDPASDLNGDGIVDGEDLAVLAEAFGRGQ